jgi:preprotein translocase subunit YajC
MKNKMKKVKMTIIRSLHFLVVSLKENVEIVVQSGIKQKITNLKRAKMLVRIAENTTIFKNMQIMALIALIVIVQVT